MIKVESLGKQYVVGGEARRTTSFRELLSGLLLSPLRRWRQLRGIDRTQERFWALQDVTFSVEEKEVVGIIGRNGAGKSTLLKVLSRITSPTTGRVTLRGRVSSLLEVGTGFHPELSGRENIFLNGAILGMTRNEIQGRFDEIVEFAEVERFIDTPIKRYSSGMFVRLAFSVAAHLETDILLVDEVLAVGDAVFQQRCLGKMQDVARGGRTVLYVSHNMGSVATLCDRAILLHAGRVTYDGVAEEAIRRYMAESHAKNGELKQHSFRGQLARAIRFHNIQVNGKSLSDDLVFHPRDNIVIRFEGSALQRFQHINLSVAIFQSGVRILTLQDAEEGTALQPGSFRSEVSIPPLLLRPGVYSIWLGAHRKGDGQWVWGEDLVQFIVLEEWGDNYEERNKGLVNIAGVGSRHGAEDDYRA